MPSSLNSTRRLVLQTPLLRTSAPALQKHYSVSLERRDRMRAPAVSCVLYCIAWRQVERRHIIRLCSDGPNAASATIGDDAYP